MRLASRDPEAFGEIYRRHSVPVMSYLARRTGSGEVAADLTSEVFAAALESLGRFETGREPVRAWLMGIANHKLADSRRRSRVEDRARRRIGFRDPVFSEDDLERIEWLDAWRRGRRPITELVDDLPISQREAVLARVVDEQDYAELAAMAGINQVTARQRVRRALLRLAQLANEGQA